MYVYLCEGNKHFRLKQNFPIEEVTEVPYCRSMNKQFHDLSYNNRSSISANQSESSEKNKL